MRFSNARWLFTVTALAVLIAGCGKDAADTSGGKLSKVATATESNIHSIPVSAAPKLDGKGGERVWKDAPAETIATKDGASVKLKSVYTENSVYFLAVWEDATEQNGVLWWEFDGEKWNRNYETDDKISFIWNIGHSMPDFDTRGCEVICHVNANGAKTMVIGGKALDGKPWEGIAYMADAWKWAPGIMNLKDSVDDGLFAAPKEARLRPETTTTVMNTLVFDGGDEGTKQWFTRNPNAASAEEKAAGIVKPAYMPKPGFDLAKNPFPNMRDMVAITDYSIFKKGDKLPMMVYFDLTNEKNKKDFPEGKPSGSRVDLTGRGVYGHYSYTLEWGRKLNTGHNDDVQFFPKKDKAVAENVFAVALFNDTRFGHTVSEPVTLIFEPAGK